MQTRHEILLNLIDCQAKRRSVKLKITHEEAPFIANIDDILAEKEVIKLKPVDAEHASLRRSSYYVDEIEKVEQVGFLSEFSIWNLFH